GKPPAPVDEDIRKKIIGDEKPITVRPADLLKPQLEKCKEKGEELGIIKKEEDILTYALYPAVAPKFLHGDCEEEPLAPPAETETPEAPKGIPTEYAVDVDGEIFNVKVKPVGYMEIEAEGAQEPIGPIEGGVTSTMQGMILKLKADKGDKVNEGDVVAVLEAMKMENDIHATSSGTVEEIFIKEGDTVNAGDTLMVIK
ncbi:MAG TPA: biotin/lipoyl-containing protein, partial [Methanobacterium sp.]|nr:biotin/lipoyl-containing protein [Methanobacterium sp.]